MAKAIKPIYYVELKNPKKGLNIIDIRTFFNHILDRYCKIGQTDIDNNITRFNQFINLILPLAV